LSYANPGGEVDVHYRQLLEMPTVEPEAAVAEAASEEVAAPALVGAALAASAEPEEAAGPEAAEAEAFPEEVAAAAEAIPEPEPIAAEAEIAPEEVETPLLVAAAIAEPQPELAPVEAAASEVAPEEVEATPEDIEAVPPVTAEPEPVAAAAALVPEPAVAAAPTIPNLEVHPRIDRLVEITIHNHSPAGAENGALEARVASLEATLDAFSRLIASIARSQPGASVDVDVASRLEQLVQLQRTGVLSDEEFAAVKAQVLGGRVEPNGLNVSSERVLR
jgi:hypothetical protein